MKIPLLIIGAGNVGGFLSYNIKQFSPEYDILGFIDDDKRKIGNKIYGREVLGGVSNIKNFIEDGIAVVIGIANPAVKKKVYVQLKNYKLHFPSFISKTAWISEKVTIGNGVIVYPGVSINYETKLDDFVIVNLNCALGHNCTVSRFSTLSPGVNLAGFTYVEENVDVGIGVSTRQNVRIGRNSIIGGQSMLVKNVIADSLVVGIPGKKIN